MIFHALDKNGKNSTKLLNINNFSWNSNDISREFQGSSTPKNFITKFDQIFNLEEHNRQSLELSCTSTAQSTSSGIQQPPKKRPRLLLPASCRATTSDDEEFDEEKMVVDNNSQLM